MKTNNTKTKITHSGEVFLLQTSSSKKSLINIQYLQDISGDNTSFVKAMLLAFRDESIVFLSQMEHGLASHDFLSMKKIAHKMKPSGAYIGADALTLLVGNLEQAAERTNSEEATSLYNGIKSLLRRIFVEIDSYLNNSPSLG
ncbi:MAG TPA: hypothetical protein DGG95_18025 [Cytophagales bacterium]|jgi:HPt (histidine-containing phosphotransfer) domain-containing protein|nr:hypothetical protein [Cytophagales bacterium]